MVLYGPPLTGPNIRVIQQRERWEETQNESETERHRDRDNRERENETVRNRREKRGSVVRQRM